MLKVKREGVLLEPTKLKFENKGVLNPACIRKGRYVHMFYRAWDKNNRSTIGYCKFDGPLKIVERLNKPLMSGSNIEDSIEDPRITLINGTYYLTYVVYDGKNVRTAYATSKDLIKFEKKGVISPEITYDEAEDLFRSCRARLKDRYFFFESYYKDKIGKDVLLWYKDAFLFPKKINGKFAMLHRIPPDIQVVYFKDFKQLTLDFWKKYLKRLCNYVVLESRHWYETRNIGGGAPPIETDKGWLLIYHAVDDMDKGKTYRAGAALLDRKNPQKVIGHLHEPLFSPEENYEMTGNINNVVFPTGTAIFNKKLYIYYGTADTKIAVVSVNLNKLIRELIKK